MPARYTTDSPNGKKLKDECCSVNGSDSVCERLLDMKVWSVSVQPSAIKNF